MGKIKKIMAGLLALIAIISLASCNKSSIEVEVTATNITSNSIKLSFAFGNYEALQNGGTVYVKRTDSSSSNDTKNLEFSNNIYSKSSCEFTGLSSETEYKFDIYVSINDVDEKIKSVSFKTKSATSEEVIEISNKDDLLDIDTDATELNYRLTDNIDLDGSEILLFDSSSSPYEGTFDGNGYEIKNFKLKSSSASGLFGYTSKATIKNLKISNVSYSSTSLRSSLSMGALVGNAIDTKFIDITIDNVLYGKRNAENQFSGATSSEVKIGGVVGYANNSYFENVNASNIAILMTKARKYVSLGLFAGYIDGNNYGINNDTENTTEGNYINEYAVKNSSASGEIYANCEYSSSFGFARIGGFVGTLSVTGKIENCYSNVEIAYTRRNGSGYVNHDISIGGFLGTDKNSKIKLANCASIADIVAYAGQKSDLHTSKDDLTTETEKTDVYNNVLATNAYIGGFAGSLSDFVYSLTNCVYVPRVDGIIIYGSKLTIVDKDSTGSDDANEDEKNEPKEYAYVGLFYGSCKATSKLSKCGYAKEKLLKFKYSYTEETTDVITNEITDLSNLSDTLKNAINKKYEKLNTIDATTVKKEDTNN